MRIFITGATGFIGRALVNALSILDHQITALVRDPESPAAQALAHSGVRLVKGDVMDLTSLRAGMSGCDTLVHCAAIYQFGAGWLGRRRMSAVNITGTANTLGIARELGLARLYYVSTAFAYGETDGETRDETWQRRSKPKSHYEATKTRAHELAMAMQQEGAPLTIFCPVAVAGPGDHSSLGQFARLYVRGRMPPVSFGDGTVSFVHLDDLVAGMTHCIDRGRVGETYLLSGGPLGIRDLFATWQTMPGGAEVTLLWLPRWLAVVFCKAAELFERLFGLPMLFSADLARSAFMDMRFTGAKVAEEFGVKFRGPRQVWRDVLNSERRRWLA